MVNQKDLAQKALCDSWRQFISTGKIAEESVRPDILVSWQKCRELGVNPYQKRTPRVLADKELELRKEANKVLITLSLPVLHNLYSFVTGSGFIVVLADKDGILLEIIGDKDVAESAQRGNFIVGADWSEKGAGTNGVGTPLNLKKPIQVFSYEHYCVASHKWTCSGAPIRDPNGEIIGVLNMTGTYEKVHSHTLGMVVAAANAIENLLVLQLALQSCEIAKNSQIAIMESIREGILGVNGEGVITHANQAGMKLLQTQDLVGKHIKDVFGEKNQLLVRYILQGKLITDYEITIPVIAGPITCTITTQPIGGSQSSNEGTVLVLNEIARVRQLVRKMVGAHANLSFRDIIGQNEKFLETLRIAKAAASSTSNVLLLGESGTGKDIFAQAIHRESYRYKGPFVAINCAAIPRELIGSELFGYAEGAFTGAKRGGNPGKFELADGGTLFLDEIGEMPFELQTMLLRVLEQRSVVRIGGQEVIPVDVRIIAATNKNLIEEVEKGNFRRDLFYRLNVITIHLVPLRERKDDIPILTNHIINRLTIILGKQVNQVDPKVMEIFTAYDWPGNVRELQNVLERAINIATSERLSPELLPRELLAVKQANRSTSFQPLEDYEKEVIRGLLEEYQGNITRVANKLGIARTTLYRKLNKLGLDG